MKIFIGLFIFCFLSPAYGDIAVKQELARLNQHIAELQAIETCQPDKPGDHHLTLNSIERLIAQLKETTLNRVQSATQNDQRIISQLLQIIDQNPISVANYQKLVQYALRNLKQAEVAKAEYLELIEGIRLLAKQGNNLSKLNSLLRLLRDYYQNDSIFHSEIARFLQIVQRESVVDSVPNYDKELGDIIPLDPEDGQALNLAIIRIKFNLEMLKRAFGNNKLAVIRIKTKKTWVWNLFDTFATDDVRAGIGTRTLKVQYDQTPGCNEKGEDKISCRIFSSEYAMQWHLHLLLGMNVPN